MPRAILAPIFAVWFGLGIASKVALGVTLVFFIVFFNVWGVKEVSPVVLATPACWARAAPAAAPRSPAECHELGIQLAAHQQNLRRRGGGRVPRFPRAAWAT